MREGRRRGHGAGESAWRSTSKPGTTRSAARRARRRYASLSGPSRPHGGIPKTPPRVGRKRPQSAMISVSAWSPRVISFQGLSLRKIPSQTPLTPKPNVRPLCVRRTAVLAMSYVHVARVLCTVCVLYGTGTRFVSAWCRVRVCVRYNIPTFYSTRCDMRASVRQYSVVSD